MLTQVAGEPVCPSDDVDKAWHLHITRTVDYERFCRATLGAVPVPALALESSDECRRATRLAYQRVFGVEAPAQVWTEAVTPPAPVPAAWQLRVPTTAGTSLALGLLAASGALAFLGCQVGLDDNLRRLDGTTFGLLVAAVFALIIALMVHGSSRTGPVERRGTLDAYEAALLDGGTPRVAATAIVMLVRLGRLQLRAGPPSVWQVFTSDAGRSWQLVAAQATGGAHDGRLHDVERACLGAAASGVLHFDPACVGVQPACDGMTRRLIAAGLMRDATFFTRARVAAIALATALLVLLIERIILTVETRALSEALPAAVLGDGLLIFMLTNLQPAVNARGRSAVQALRDSLDVHLKAAARKRPRVLGTGVLPTAIALLGPEEVLGDPGFEGLDRAIGASGMHMASPKVDD